MFISRGEKFHHFADQKQPGRPGQVHVSAALLLFFGLVLLILLPSAAPAATVLFTTRRPPPSTDAAELARISAIEGLGYTVLQIHSRATTPEYQTALGQSDVVYVSERVLSTEVAANLKTGCTGVITEEVNLHDEFGIVSGNNQWGFYNDGDNYRVYINRTAVDHYILQDFPLAAGNFSLFTTAASQDMQYLDDAPYPAAYDLLAWTPDQNFPTLVAIETGDQLADGTIAAGRRVALPWFRSQSSAADFNAMTVSGQNILRRALEWGLADNECSFMQKRAFLPNGTPLADGAQVGTGSTVKFLIYINNKGGAINDISIQDILDPTFSYSPETMQIDNSRSECALNTCSAAEESAIFAAVNSAPFRADDILPSADGARFDGTNTIDIGDRIVTNNGQVDITANSVWALLFSVTMN